MGEFYVVRHGETDFNRKNRYLGSTDIELNTTGIAQAHILAEHCINLGITTIISSSLVRCKQTAAIIADRSSIPLVINSNLRERHLGVYEGLTKEEAKKQYPQLWERNITRQWYDAPTGGESIHQVIKRVDRELNIIKSIYSNGIVLIVTHGFISKVINYYCNPYMSKNDFYKFELENGEYVCFSF